MMFHICWWCNDGTVGLLRWTRSEVGIREVSEPAATVARPRQTAQSERVGGTLQQRVQPTNGAVAAQRVCTETKLEVIERRAVTTPTHGNKTLSPGSHQPRLWDDMVRSLRFFGE